MVSLSIEYQMPDTPLTRGEAGQIASEELSAGLRAGVNIVRNEIVPLIPVNFGVLRDGVQVEVTGTPADLTGRVFNNEPYGPAVELGSRPHFPPLGPIELWVRRKLGVTGDTEARSVAFLVARKISREGTKAVHMFLNGTARARGPVLARMHEAHRRIVLRWQGRG